MDVELGKCYGSEHAFGKAVETAALLVVGRLLQQNSSHKRGGRGQKPFDAPHLDGLELGQGRGFVEEADADGSGDAAKADHEGDERGGRQADPALDLMEVQIVDPGWKGNLLPGSRDGG